MVGLCRTCLLYCNVLLQLTVQKFCLDLCHTKPVQSVSDHHFPRLTSLHNIMNLPVHNFTAGEKVNQPVVKVIVCGILKVYGVVADVACLAVTDGCDDGAVWLQLTTKRQRMMARSWVTGSILFCHGMDNSPGWRFGHGMLNRRLIAHHVHVKMSVKELRTGNILRHKNNKYLFNSKNIELISINKKEEVKVGNHAIIHQRKIQCLLSKATGFENVNVCSKVQKQP